MSARTSTTMGALAESPPSKKERMLMPRTILLAAALPAPPDRLYDMYLDAKLHADFTGAPVVIVPAPKTPFSAFDGMLSGRTLHLQPKQLIVQAWRSANWQADALDSTLTLSFW